VLPHRGITALPAALQVWQTVVAISLGLTPPWARRLLGYRGHPVSTATARAAAVSLRLVLKGTPPRVYRSAVQTEAERRLALHGG
jgi:uncharacterized protein (DUF2236 family)